LCHIILPQRQTSNIACLQKITFADMRDQGVRGLLIYCADYRCSHSLAIGGDRRPDDLKLSDIEPRFICGACGHRGADVRPEFNCNIVRTMGYRRNAKPADLGRAMSCQ
jgi:hypothetical protein